MGKSDSSLPVGVKSMGEKEEAASYGSVVLVAVADGNTNHLPPRPETRWGTRHTFALLAFLGFANVYAMRVNLSVAIVAMVNTTTSGDSSSSDACPLPPPDISQQQQQNSSFPTHHGGEFNWDSRAQGKILGSFFVGYVLTQIPGGMLAEAFGGKWLFGLGTLVTALFTLLTPMAARHSLELFCVVRFLEGLGEGVTFPAMHAMVAKWIPLEDKSKLGAFITAGCQFGTFISLVASGFLATYVDWESVFYVFGILGIIWFFAWAIMVFNTPSEHPRITQIEREYIESHIPHSEQLHHNTPSSSRCCCNNFHFPPMWSIVKSVPFWALVVAHMGQNWGLYTLLTETPTYLANIQHFSLKASGFLSGLPYLLMWLSSMAFGLLSKRLTEKNYLTRVQACKLFNSIGLYGPALGLVWLAYAGCNSTSAMAALCLSVGLNGAVYSGFQFNHVDLSPNYAGTLMGITNTFANIVGFATTYVTGAIINDNPTLEAWRTVFLLCSAIYVIFNTFYICFAQAEVQPWNDHRQQQQQQQHQRSD